MKPRIPSVLITFALVCFALSPRVQAVVPAPDGGYPNFTTAEGQNALFSLTTGSANTAVGWFSLRNDTTGSNNTAIGAGALLSNDTGRRNTATGVGALLSNHGGLLGAGSFNTANGTAALLQNSTGFGNTAIGDNALSSNTTGSNNTALGFSAGTAVITASNVIAIGTEGANVDNTCFIGNIRDVAVNASGTPVVIDLNNQLGTIVSSRRFKKEIRLMDNASEALLALKPVTFHYKSDKTDTPQFGLVAEDVAQVNPDLVVRDKHGEIYSVRYDAVNAMLLNEFLKEHRKNEEQGRDMQEQKATIALQQKQIDALTAGLQKVSAQLEASKPAPQVVDNP
jgi:Chaperone of endosialidase